MFATITRCEACDALFASLMDAGRPVAAKQVPGTGDLNCETSHARRGDVADDVSVAGLVHVALSSILRHPSTPPATRDMAHVLQDWLSVPESLRRTSRLPGVITSGHDVNDIGLALARILAGIIAKRSQPREAFWWTSAASVMRRKLR